HAPFALHPNGKWCVSLSDEALVTWSVTDGSLVRRVPLDVPDDRYAWVSDKAIVILPGSGRVVVATSRSVDVVDPESGVLVETLAGPAVDLAVAPGGTLFASAGDDGYVRVWDARTLRCVWTEHAHRHGAAGVAFFGEDAVVSVGGDRVARLWDIET